MDNHIKEFLSRHEIERLEKWRECSQEIPYIKFKQEWEVKIIPPFAGAMARFMVKSGNANVSIYLDVYDVLGCCNGPYWEIYPHGESVYRCDIDETDKLVNAISESISQQK
jgi:hypothetical protein